MLAAAILLLTAFMNTRPVLVAAVTAEKKAVALSFVEEGRVRANEDYEQYSAVSGNVLEVCAGEGSYVEAGIVIARIDPREYVTEIAVQNSTIEGYRSQARISIQELAREQCQIELAYSRDQLNKNKALLAAGIISQAEFDAVKQSYDTLNQRLEQIEQQEKNITQSYEAMIAASQQEISRLQQAVEDCTIMAEKTGYIAGLPVQNLSSVAPRTLVCTIKEAKSMVVESYVSTEDVVFLAVGDEVELIQETREAEYVYPGQITKIEPWAQERMSALGVAEHRVRVTIRPTEEVTTAGSGFNLDVRFFTFHSEASIALPNSAFYRYDGQDYVCRISPAAAENTGVIQAVPVVKGMSSNTETVVLEGLSEGDIVVEHAKSQEIFEGSKVRW